MSSLKEKMAMMHPNKLGAGARKRDKYFGHNPKTKAQKQGKVHVVMSEFKRGTLHSGSGSIVTNPKQGIAIALSEAGLSRKKKKS